MKEFGAEVFDKPAHLFEPQRVINWNMREQRGPTYGEFALVPNPPTQADFYYYLKEDVESAQIVVTDLEGNQLTAINGEKESGLYHASWNLRGRPAGGRAGGGQPAGRPGGGGFGGDPAGRYKITLVVNGEDVMTHYLTVEADPLNPVLP
jgi:hypothetical protein